MIKINHRIVFWIFSILIIGMILLSCGCNQLLKFYFPQSFSVSKNEMTTNDPLQNAKNYNYRIRAQNYADLVSYLPSNSTPVDLRIPNELAGIPDILSLVALTSFIILISQYVGILKYKIEKSKNKRR